MQPAQRLRAGQPVRVEGPYGRFDLGRRHPRAQQIWVAGGIGITSFLSHLRSGPVDQQTLLLYLYRAEADAAVAELNAPSINPEAVEGLRAAVTAIAWRTA